MAEDGFVVHNDPVWRARSNFVIHAELAAAAGAPARFEQLFARQIDDDRFEVCCIPFFVCDVALGDVVRTAPAGERAYVVESVVLPSARFVFRVWFGASAASRDEIADELLALGALIEWSSTNLLAVDAVDGALAQRIADVLAAREHSGDLVYETGRS